MSARGQFIVLEGIDGSGKSTQAVLLAQRLAAAGVRCNATREPTDGAVGALIRQVLTGALTLDARTLATLFAADRLDHLLGADGLLQQLDGGATVVCDRYYFSSYAYHSVDVPLDWVLALNAQAAALLKPTCTLFIDVDPATAMRRIAAGRAQTELFETHERLQAVRGRYLDVFETLAHSERVLIVDGNGTPDAVADAVWAVVAPLVGAL